jgi:hypothetical protein
MRSTAVFGFIALLLLGGCGIKPAEVSAPPGAKDTFPRTYPAPEAGR